MEDMCCGWATPCSSAVHARITVDSRGPCPSHLGTGPGPLGALPHPVHLLEPYPLQLVS